MVDSVSEVKTDSSHHGVVAWQEARSQLEADLEAFLAQGGSIVEVP